MRRLLSILAACCCCLVAMLVAGVDVNAAREKVCLCHVPPGNPGNAHTICVSPSAVRAHTRHGDTRGECPVACGGAAGDTCGDGQFCRIEGEACSEEAEGVCTDTPGNCPTTIDPVCGCDGNTYDNACLANAAGVNVDHEGACTGGACGGDAGDTCEDNQFCKREAGECGEDVEGVCVDLPLACPLTQDPVCGCDGITYANSCFADGAGVTVAQAGACPEPTACGGDAGDTCEDDQFCKRELGECGEEAEGVCTNTPAACQPTQDPVCGCDGITYANSCTADGAGVSVAHAGACEEPTDCGGAAGDTCDDDQFCKREAGDCGEDAEGVCTDIPAVCQPIQDPVCGCDDVTYSSACLADGAGVSVAHAGACDEGAACGGDAGDSCEEGEFCKTADGACGGEGTCTPAPAVCPSSFMPVCGCDGTSYSNACFANAAGVAVQRAGLCEVGAACGGTGGGTCEEGQFCRPAVGDCAENAEGNCTPIPAACPRTYIPVCGCDGTTYANPCLAAGASVGISHLGPCEGDQQACGGDTGGSCEEGEFCKRPEGACAEDAEGVCATTPAVCPAIVDPVCGCDGTTYSSACVADGAGVTVDHEGACVEPQACSPEAPCAEGEFCKGEEGACAEDAAGVCTTLPLACPVIVNEVCGCDATTYLNSCLADAAGVTISHGGACTVP